jgi:hypothetical protein
VAKRTHNGRTDLRKAAFKRLRDARALLRGGKENARGAAYIGGYAVECKLKAIALEVFDCWNLDQLAAKWRVREHDVYTHGLEAILRHLPIYNKFRASPIWAKHFASHVNTWRVHWRYDPHDWPTGKAEAFLLSVEEVYNWIDSNRS